MSPITRRFVEMSHALNNTPLSSGERLRAMEIFTKELTPEQKKLIERECLKAAIDAQRFDTRRGNRAQRRAQR
jgi:hypothetical protein